MLIYQFLMYVLKFALNFEQPTVMMIDYNLNLKNNELVQYIFF